MRRVRIGVRRQPFVSNESVVAVGRRLARDQHPLFEVSPTLAESRELGIKPLMISLGLDPSAFAPELGGFSDPGQSPDAQRKAVFDTAVRGSDRCADRIWLFHGDSFVRYFEKPDTHETRRART